MRGFLLGLSISIAFIVGCAAASIAPQLVVPPVRAGTDPQRWEYRCVIADTKITDVSNRLGAEGWEMSGAAAYGYAQGLLQTGHMVWCFKRPLPQRWSRARPSSPRGTSTKQPATDRQNRTGTPDHAPNR